jgi:hypothetical protein
MTIKLRKTLPAFAQVNGLTVDLPKLLSELVDHGLFDADYTAVSSTVDNTENLFIKANMACKRFFNADDDVAYQEVNLSKPSFASPFLNENDAVRDVFAIYRTKRLDPSKPEYSEHADERNHNIEPKYLTDGSELQHVFSFFKGKPCRVRISRMKAGTSIKPHVDYDPSYIFRYHIPLITNSECRFHAEGVDVHLPADGRVFWLNTGKRHWVTNGPTDRYHLLIDVTGDKEVNNLEHFQELSCIS